MSFDEIFDRVVQHEGGFSDDPNDPGNWTGGRVGKGKLKGTKYGVSAASYPKLNIRALTLEQAKEIYKQDFWAKIYADRLPPGAAFQLLDFAVHSGVETGIRALQRAVEVADDGDWGPITQAAVEKTSHADLIMGLCAERCIYMARLSNWDRNSRGWIRRIAENLKFGIRDS